MELADIRAKITADVHEEVERWKAVHDAELARRRKSSLVGTVIAIALGFLLSLGTGHLWYENIARDASEKAIETHTEIMGRMTNLVASAATRSKHEAERAERQAREAADIAQKAAEAARVTADKEYRRLLKEFTDNVKEDGTAIATLIKEVVDGDETIVRNHDTIQLQFGTLRTATEEASAKSFMGVCS